MFQGFSAVFLCFSRVFAGVERGKKSLVSGVVFLGFFYYYHCKKGVCRKFRKLFKNLVTIFFKNLFGKLVHIFGELVHIFGELVHIFALKLVSKFFETSFEKFGAIMAAGGLQ